MFKAATDSTSAAFPDGSLLVRNGLPRPLSKPSVCRLVPRKIAPSASLLSGLKSPAAAMSNPQRDQLHNRELEKAVSAAVRDRMNADRCRAGGQLPPLTVEWQD